MQYQKENDKLINSFLNRTFFRTWRNQKEGLENFRSLELFINTKCNLKCSYCYLANYGEKLYPPEFQDDKKVLSNLEIFLDWLLKNNFAPKIDFFAGDPLVQRVGLQALEMILDKFKDAKNKPKIIVIPTNYTFILSATLTREVEDLLEKSRNIGIPILLSTSMDGKYCEANRPFKERRDEPRNDEYYDRVFAFNKKWRFTYHPMIYSEHIEDWKDNFLWFQEMLRKHDAPWHSIYFLEVRNKEWSKKQILKFEEFIDFLIKWTFSVPCRNDPQKYLNFLFQDGFNILRNPLSTTGRGLGCSVQSVLYVRLGDLAIVPCHRTSYEPLVLGHFIVKNGKITGIRAHNPELMIGIISMEGKAQPMCESCLIKHLCARGCLGSQLETTGDLFSPIPTVCQLAHAKIEAMIRAYRDLGILNLIYDKVNPDKKKDLRYIEEMIK